MHSVTVFAGEPALFCVGRYLPHHSSSCNYNRYRPDCPRRWLRYANGQANGRTLSLYVNGTYVRQLTLPVVAPADWSQWEMLAFDIPLDAGKNTVVFVCVVLVFGVVFVVCTSA